MRGVARGLFWLSLLVVVFATLAPIQFRPTTGLPPQLERFAGFLIIAVPLMVGYPRFRLPGACALLLVAAGLEALQNVVPGRHGRLQDFEAKAAGVAAGVLLGWLAEAFAGRRDHEKIGSDPGS